MKINIPEKIRQAIRKSSLPSRILFGLMLIPGILWAWGGFRTGDVMFFVTGLMGVLWLSSVALHSAHGGRRMNPFTLLVVLCIAVGLGSYIYALGGYAYHQENEPIELLSQDIQGTLNAAQHDEDSFDELKNLGDMMLYPLGGVQYNMIVTDAEDHLLYARNSWRTGSADQFYPLAAADTDLTILMGDDEQVVSTALRDEKWTDARFVSSQSGLTRTQARDDEEEIAASNPGAGLTRQMDTEDVPNEADAAGTTESDIPGEPEATASPDTAQPEAEPKEETAKERRERLVRLYFPEFGRYTDQYIPYLNDDMLMVDNPAAGLEGQRNWTDISLYDWQGETVIGLDREIAVNSTQQLRGLVQELNAMDEAERAALKEYAAWYDSARDSARLENRNQVYIRMFKSEDGSLNAYLIYEYDHEALTPLRQKHMRDQQQREFFANLTLCMIPAAIVFLAFWVLVDAKKRGQSHPALWAVLTLIGNIVAFIIYMMVRPQMTVGLTGKAAPKGVCPLCGARLKDDFIACPGCGILLRRSCKNCGRALENDWSFCPYCTRQVEVEEKPEIAAADQKEE